MRVLSGIQPTGNLHLGNYLGAIRNWVRMQDEMDSESQCFFFLADMHSITVHEGREQRIRNVRDMAAALVAAGIDPDRSVLFNQARVPAHAELCWLLNGTARPESFSARSSACCWVRLATTISLAPQWLRPWAASSPASPAPTTKTRSPSSPPNSDRTISAQARLTDNGLSPMPVSRLICLPTLRARWNKKDSGCLAVSASTAA